MAARTAVRPEALDSEKERRLGTFGFGESDRELPSHDLGLLSNSQSCTFQLLLSGVDWDPI
jgi:hypothetical protein